MPIRLVAIVPVPGPCPESMNAGTPISIGLRPIHGVQGRRPGGGAGEAGGEPVARDGLGGSPRDAAEGSAALGRAGRGPAAMGRAGGALARWGRAEVSTVRRRAVVGLPSVVAAGGAGRAR